MKQQTKKAYSDTAISEQARQREWKRQNKRLISRCHDTTLHGVCRQGGQSKIKFLCELIPIGEAHAIKSARIAAMLHCDKRVLRTLIHKARKQGYPICGTNNGLYFPASIEETLLCIRRLKAQRNSISQDIRHIERAINNYKGARRR